jgi:prefoldin subunit 5
MSRDLERISDQIQTLQSQMDELAQLVLEITAILKQRNEALLKEKKKF